MSWLNAEHFCYMGPRWCVYGFSKVVRYNTRIVLWIMPRSLSSTFFLVHYLLMAQRLMKRQTLFSDTASSSLPPNLIYGVNQLSFLYIVRFLVCSRLCLVYFFLWPLSPTAHAFLSYCCSYIVILYQTFCKCNCIVLPVSRVCSPVLRSAALTRF